MSIKNLLHDNPLVIVDIGASGGIDRRWTRFTHACRGILFEPDPREYERLRADGSARLVVLNAALSDTAGSVDFHLCRKQQTSSVFLPNLEFLRRFPQIERFDITRTLQMETDTLDHQLQAHAIDDIDFIKIDTQGYELPILRGSAASLARAAGLQIEVSFAPIYRDQPLFADVDAHMRAHGFELFDLKRHFWRRKDIASGKGQLIYADAVYFRPPEQIAGLSGLSAQKAMRALCVYLAYERTDIARELLNRLNEFGMPSAAAREHANAAIASIERRMAWRNIRRLRRLRRALAKMAERLRWR
jgi:FkbM family methyltransferase